MEVVPLVPGDLGQRRLGPALEPSVAESRKPMVRALRAAGAVARSPLRRGAALRGDGRPCGAFVDPGPDLVLHRRDNSEEKPDGGRYLAAHIPGARFVELDGHDHFPGLAIGWP